MVLLTATARAAGPVYDSVQGGFTFQAPKGWTIYKQPVEEYPALFGPDDEDGPSPYVVITEVDGQPDLFALGDATMKELLKDKLYQLSKRDAFHTADDRVGLKYVLITPMPNSVYRQIFYFVEGPGDRRFCFLATVPEASWQKYDVFMDNMMKSYHLRAGVTPPSNPGDAEAMIAPPTVSNTTAAAMPPVHLPTRVAGK
jgi:hypothetical protein